MRRIHPRAFWILYLALGKHLRVAIYQRVQRRRSLYSALDDAAVVHFVQVVSERVKHEQGYGLLLLRRPHGRGKHLGQEVSAEALHLE